MERAQANQQLIEEANATDTASEGKSLRLVVRRVRVTTNAKAGSAAPSTTPDGTGGEGHRVW